MKLSQDALISDEKLTKYLLASRRRNDKSGWLAQAHMKYDLFTEVVLAQDIPDKGLKQGDVATVVECHELPGRETGYSLEIFNAIGDTIAVVTVPESRIEPLTEDEVFSVRSRATGS